MISVLADDVLCVMMSFLDSKSLLQMQLVNQRCHQVGSRNEAGWENLCNDLWKDKVHVLHEAIRIKEENSMLAYRLSVEDAKQRQEVRLDEFCYDIETKKGTIWSFRFKESAGLDWTSWDPWWNGHDARKMVFLPDGTVKQVVEPDESNTNDDEDSEQQQQQQPIVPQFGKHGGILVDMLVPITWRFLTQPLDLQSRAYGSYLRLTLGNRDVPTYVVRRSPTGNWGFLMESCWGLYASFDLPPRRSSTPRLRLRRTQDGARLVDVNLMESDTENDDENDGSSVSEHAKKQKLLVDDSFLLITNEVQWKEALLYNLGASTLPEGEGAEAEFHRKSVEFRGTYVRALNERGLV